MEVPHRRCARLDVHKDTVVAAVRLLEGDGTVRREVETFVTTTPGLVALPRLRDHLRPMPGPDTVPLLYPGLSGRSASTSPSPE